MNEWTSLKENRDFRRLYGRGKSYISSGLVVYAARNRCRSVRMGITTSKKVGNAVLRSRSRRVIREAFRAVFPEIRPGYDFVLVARSRTPHLKSTELTKVLRRLLREAGVLL